MQVFYAGRNIVVCAPTGSGKTVLFELAIIRQLMETSEPWADFKAVYSKYYEKYMRMVGRLAYTEALSLHLVGQIGITGHETALFESSAGISIQLYSEVL